MPVDADVRYSRKYGTGTLMGKDRDFFNRPLDEQVKAMGWSHACPVIETVVEEYGADWTLRRYAECNFVFGLITAAAKDSNPALRMKLTTPVGRYPSEPVGVFTENTPDSHKKQMASLATPWGYALPRVVIEQFGRGENRTSERMFAGLKMIDEAVKKSMTPTELVVKLARMTTDKDADPKAVLSHLLPVGVLKEENTRIMYQEIIDQMKKEAPELAEVYDSVPLDERESLGILTLT